MINIDLRADDFDAELEKVRIMNRIKKANRKAYYSCKAAVNCINSPEYCPMCVRSQDNAGSKDGFDFFDDKEPEISIFGEADPDAE